MTLQEDSGDTTIFFSTVLRQNISGRSVCIMNLIEGHEMPQRRPRPSVYDTTNTVLVRSLKTILSECFGVQIILYESTAEAFLDVNDGQVFISSTTNLIADGLKIQNPYVRVCHAHKKPLTDPLQNITPNCSSCACAGVQSEPRSRSGNTRLATNIPATRSGEDRITGGGNSTRIDA
jgi:hypothetical protein